ncbi:hypothetical protein [Streptomyces sp. CBMA152]|uniref:hypothetical protein n=1 Tax=Streptomyces sp. CBMA152 TaxID=1896312 RepID=UPI0016609EB1|nr:hypothetical protein [Streptomyces sp. CBMA152]
MLVAILLSASGGGSSADTARAAQDGPKYFNVSTDASATEYGLLATPDATAIEYGLL